MPQHRTTLFQQHNNICKDQGEGHYSMISELLSFLSPCCQSDTPDQLHCSASGIWSNKVTTPRPSEKEIAQLHWSKKMTVVTEVYKRQETTFC